MKLLLTAVAVLILASAAAAQQHAPTVEQCNADRAVWHNDWINNPVRAFKNLSYKELVLRRDEMVDCAVVDKNSPFNDYIFLPAVFVAERAARADSFISRHGLDKQFLDEDAAGAR